MKRVAIIALALAATSCVRDSLIPCGELACPTDRVCDAIHGLCVLPVQMRTCVGIPDAVPCNADGAIGQCLDAVCLIPVCGDHFIEPGEACDDGNQLDGDGCSRACTSDETCGNGVIDLALGEQCDDGGAISADGCSSRCLREALTWQLEGINPTAFEGVVYDATHRQLLSLSDGITWTWDGTRWSIVTMTGLPAVRTWTQTVDVPERGGVVLTARVDAAVRMWGWDGATWTELVPSSSAPVFDTAAVAYDRDRRAVLFVGQVGGSTEFWSLDAATLVWTQGPAPGSGQPFGFVYDEARGRAVLALGNNIHEWDGTMWTATGEVGGGRMVYVARLGAVVGVGSSIQQWTGTGWTVLPGALYPTLNLNPPAISYDGDRDRVIAFGGSTSANRPVYTVGEWDGAAWTLRSGHPEFYYAPELTYDTRRRRLIHYGMGDASGTRTFAFDGAWRELDRSPVNANSYYTPVALAYDPVRDGVVLNGQDRGTYVLTGDSWTTLEAPGASAVDGFWVMVFDPIRGGVVGVAMTGTWLLASDATQWTRIADRPPTSADSIAFDARTGELVAASTYGYASRFDGTSWVSTVASSTTPYVGTDPRRGTVVMLSATGATYERVDQVWQVGPPLPLAVDGPPVSAPDLGELLIVGSLGNARVLLRRRYGELAVDRCEGGDDDGDELVDCDDPECWWLCTPACPPFTSCL